MSAARPTVIDLFAGCGGFSFGFTESGFEVLKAVENFRTACETYASNVPVREVLNADVRAVEASDFPERPDVLIGGPPCEAYTVANADRRRAPLDRLYKDPLGSLTIRYLQLLKMIKPRSFVMENVPQILDGELRAELHDLFKRAGYPKVHENELRAEEHGTPSERRRVFLSNVEIAPPKDARRITVWEAIGDLESLEVDIPNHEAMPIRGKRGRKMAELEVGESVYHYRSATGKVHGSWTRLDANRLAPTVKGLGRFVHPTQDRLLTPREHARLMGYPDDYVFHGGKNDQYNQVGESVPPPLSKAIAGEVRKALGAPLAGA